MNNKPSIPKKPPVYSLQQLADYLSLHELLTGEKLTEFHVSPDFYTYYINATQKIAGAYGFKPSDNGKVTFYNVELIKKLHVPKKKIVVPGQK